MRYLIDTNIFINMVEDRGFLSNNVAYIVNDYSNLLYISSESVKELLHLFQAGKVGSRTWKNAKDIADSIENEWNVTIKYVQRG